MKHQNPFRTLRLAGRPPSPSDAQLYRRLYGKRGGAELDRNLQDQGRYGLSPWTLQLAGADAGVGGFRIGFGAGEGLEILLKLLPDHRLVGLPAEFLADALLYAEATLRADRVFCTIGPQSDLSARMLRGRGFTADPVPAPVADDVSLMQWRATSLREA
jgi:hypothetical protein